MTETSRWASLTSDGDISSAKPPTFAPRWSTPSTATSAARSCWTSPDQSHHDLSHHDLSHHDLSHHDLSHNDLSHHDLSHHDLSHHDLSHHDQTWFGGLLSCQGERIGLTAGGEVSINDEHAQRRSHRHASVDRWRHRRR